MSSHSQHGSNMAPVSWKALTSSRLSSLKDYVAHKDYKAAYDALSSRVRRNKDGGSRQTWDQWARQTLGSSTDVQRGGLGVEKVQLFPGWAVRRYKDPSRRNEEGAEFALDVYVSGFSSSLRPPEAATRSQKAFYRLAKGYAALPKLPSISTSSSDSSQQRPGSWPQNFDIPSDIDLSKLPPPPSEITDESELEALEAHFREVSTSSSASSSYTSDGDDDTLNSEKDSYPQQKARNAQASASDSSDISYHMEHPRSGTGSTLLSQLSPEHTILPEQTIDYVAQKLHANLDARLQPFWSNAIPNRMIRLSIYCPHSGHAPSETHDAMHGQEIDVEPLIVKDVTTSPQGAFQTLINVPWERLATHPPTLHVAFGECDVEYPVVIQAEMWAPPLPSGSSTPSSVPYLPYQRANASRSHPQLSATSSSTSDTTLAEPFTPEPGGPSIKNRVTVSLSRPHVPLRVISDIDDTVKHSGILMGAKTVFRNVFVRQLDELVIRSMVDWYKALWHKGVRFHYVSNSPFELLPVLTEFFQVSTLPQGSIRLKSYAARSLLPALLSPPAARKRQGVVEVLDVFPESRFILVGDTGEQDLELYAELARERPGQIVGVFLRNVTTDPAHDATLMTFGTRHSYGAAGGVGALHAQFGGLLVDKEPERIRAMPSMESLSSTTSAPSTHGESPYSNPSFTPTASAMNLPGGLPQKRKSTGGMTLEERRRHDLEMRLERARAEIPRHTAFRVFREPEECVEMRTILDQILGSTK